MKKFLYSLYRFSIGITVRMDMKIINGLRKYPTMRKVFKFIFVRTFIPVAIVVIALVWYEKVGWWGAEYISNGYYTILAIMEIGRESSLGRGILWLLSIIGVYVVGFQVVAFPIAIVATYKNKNAVERDNELDRLPKFFNVEKYIKKGYILVGLTKDKRPVYMDDKRRTSHVEGIGSTGAGKTENIIYTGIKQDIESGKGVLLIDGKGDMLNAITIYEMCKNVGREKDFRLFSINDVERSGSYNPFIIGTPTGLKDLIVGSIDWSEIYYKRECEDAVQTMMMVLKEIKGSFCLYDIYRCFDEAVLEDYLSKVQDSQNRIFLKDMLASYSKIYKDIKSIRSEVGLLLKTEFSKLFDSINPNIDLLDAYQNNRIVYFALDVQAYGETSRRLGKIVIQNLKMVSSYIINKYNENQRKIFPVYIDEFQAFATENFIDILNRSRSAGFAVTIVHQSLGDLNIIAPGFQDQVVENTYYTIVLPVKSPATAEYMARVIGTKLSKKVTSQVDESMFIEKNTGLGSVREVEEFHKHPNIFKNLKLGEAVVISKNEGAFIVKLAHTPASKKGIEIVPTIVDKDRNLLDRAGQVEIIETDKKSKKTGELKSITKPQKEFLEDLIKKGKLENQPLDSLTKDEAIILIDKALGKA